MRPSKPRRAWLAESGAGVEFVYCMYRQRGGDLDECKVDVNADLSCKHPHGNSQDGDFSTSWTCNAADLSGVECTLDFDLFSYHHIKQIKIGKLLMITTHITKAPVRPRLARQTFPKRCEDY